MKKYSIFAVLFVLLPFLAQGASTVDPTIPKAPYASSGSCTTGYNYKDGYCRWSLDPAPIRNNFAAAYNDITALQNNSLTLSTPITVTGDCAGVGVATGISLTCNSILRAGNNLSDVANTATARSNLGTAPVASPVFTGSVTLPSWTTAGRPASPANGTIGFNSTTNRFEHYNGSWLNWARLSGDTFTGSVGISDATASSSTGTGALTVAGGLGVLGNINFGGTIAGNGSGLTGLNASSLSTGTVPAARLGSGTANSSTILYGDNVFRTAPSGGGTPGGSSGQIQYNNAGAFGGVAPYKLFADMYADPSILRTFSSRLNDHKQGNRDFLWLEVGDSLQDGVQGGTRLSSQSRMMVNALSQQYGLGTVHDNAWLGCGDDGHSGAVRSVVDPRITKGSSWSCDNTDLTIGGGMWACSTTTNALSFKPDIATNQLIVYYKTTPSSGSFTVDYQSATGGSNLGLVTQSATAANGVGTLTFNASQGWNTYNIKCAAATDTRIIGVIAKLTSRKNFIVANAGVGGSSSSAAVDTTNPWSFGNMWSVIQPDLTDLNYSTNDATFAVSIPTFTSNIQSIITQAKATGDVLVWTPPPSNPSYVAAAKSYAFQDTYNNVIRSLAASNSVALADFNKQVNTYELGSAEGLYQDTYVHMSSIGNAKLASSKLLPLFKQETGGKNGFSIVGQSVDTLNEFRFAGNIMWPSIGAGSNTLIGHPFTSMTTAVQNVALGNGALGAGTTVINSTAIGYQALNSLSTQQNNTAVGYQALKVSAANDNTAFGVLAGSKITSGTNNTVIGRGVASTTLVTGSNNTLIGGSSAIDTPAAGTSSWLTLDDVIVGSKTAPTAGTCGTGPTLATGTSDIRGTVTTGTGATACTLTFATAKANAPTCIVSARSGTPPVYTTSTAALTLSTAAASATYDYFCSGK